MIATRSSRLVILCASAVLGVLSPGNTVGAMMTELGCLYCHADLPGKSSLRDMAPDLSSAGLRYNPAYLFEFLQRPTKVRQYLGRARMPDFHFSPPEALALAAFLQ